MTRDFEDTVNFDQMDDDDIAELLRQHLDEAEEFDVESVEIEVRDGRVSVEGRVGTEQERQHVEQVLTALGAVEYDNNVVVDESTRAERSEAADIASLEDAAVTDAMGERAKSTSDTTEHLREDTAAEQFGTRDMKRAIEQGQSFNPPDGPLQEGTGGGETH
ncbi:MAG TPA: BON domain-containing protein [Longimicrobiales bacterium]|nr:BON domain-containing protein [Longimicrobiales bacterium]